MAVLISVTRWNKWLADDLDRCFIVSTVCPLIEQSWMVVTLRAPQSFSVDIEILVGLDGGGRGEADDL